MVRVGGCSVAFIGGDLKKVAIDCLMGMLFLQGIRQYVGALG